MLQLYYDLAEGLLSKRVDGLEIIEKLGIKNSNYDKFLSAFEYLFRKEFIIGDYITHLGIDEVENNFPSFVEIGEKEFHIPAGAYYTARKFLREIIIYIQKY